MSAPDPAEDRVRAAWDTSRLGLGIGPDPAALNALVAAYREPHRRYHDLSHVAACLVELEAVASLAARPAEVMTALLFHDVVYVPLAGDNEARSAQLAAEALERGGAAPEAVLRVRAAILGTRTHEAPADADAALVCDVDLSILAAPPTVFDAYERGVREEHAMIPDEAFARGRSAFVRSLSSRPRLFHTPVLAERWEAAARANLRRSLLRARPHDAAV